MESRLPKPSGLKRPTIRTIVPSDRMVLAKLPLTATDTNFLLKQPSALVKRRAASPDLGPTVSRAKLRRSRSASELRPNANRAIRFMGSSLESVPANLSKSTNALRGNTQPAALSKSKLCPFPKITSSSRIGGTTSSTASTTISSLKRSIPTTQASAPAPLKKPALTKPVPSKAAPVKPAVGGSKKIAPYDYKSRFLALQDRYKALKDKYDESQEQLNEYSSVSEQYEESQGQLIRCQEQLKNEEATTVCLRQQISSHAIKVESLTQSLAEKLDEVKTLKAECENLTTENRKMKPELLEIREKYAAQVAVNDKMEVALRETQESLFRSNMERKELHNVVMDLRGNIRVFCRVRPPLETEEQKLLCGWQYLDETSLEISSIDNHPSMAGQRKGLKHEFSFDQVFHPRSSQEDIFELVSPLIQSAMDGYNVCIFAYGQTGSGKTFTMDGVSDNIGIIPRTVDLLFDCIRNYRHLGWEYTIQVTFLEIYNEVLYDLLSNETKDMDIRMVSAKSTTDIYVTNITEVTVASAVELRELMRLAKSNRATAATVGNERSSRSHAVTRLQLVGTHSAKAETSIGTINLVDLAGSESPKTSIRMEETKKINKSLSELTNVIMALMQRQEHIPYRNSKLTHLLMPCLGGNSKTLMFINVAPFQDCFVESVKSLRFAASVNSCKMSKAKRNKYLNASGE